VSTTHKYWRVYEAALEALSGRDLAERCEAGGLHFDPEGIEIAFLDRRYRLCRGGSSLAIVNVSPSCPEERIPTEEARTLSPELQEEHLRDRILILHYLSAASGVALSGAMVGFDQLSGARFYGKPFRGRVEIPLVRAFAPRPAQLVQTAQRLGGSPAAYGDCSVLLRPFPRVPMAFILWQGDDEVPSNGKVLWDSTAEEYLCAEDLTVLGETVVRRFLSVARDGEGEPPGRQPAQRPEGARRAAGARVHGGTSASPGAGRLPAPMRT